MYAFEKKKWDEFKALSVKAKLADLLESLKSQEELAELFDLAKDTKVGPNLNNFTVSIDTANSEVDVVSNAQDAQGRPLYEWKLDPSHKLETITTHDENGTNEKVKEKHVEQAEIDHAKFSEFVKDEAEVTKEFVNQMNETKEASQKASFKDMSWDEAEAQRDIAFKVMYFFITLVIITFGVLYAYFSMVQKAENAARQMRKGAKGTLDDQSTEGREMTFADFLSGQTDVSYLVHPHANPMG